MRIFLTISVFLCLLGCSNRPTQLVVKPSSTVTAAVVAVPIVYISNKQDIPNISKTYSEQLKQLKIGMTKQQVENLFPYMEKECFPSGVCNITVFEQRSVRLNPKLTDVKKLTGSIISLLALTCAIANDECAEVFTAMWYTGVASAIEANKVSSEINNSRVLTLLQWINIEFIDDQVSQWAINEPLSQFKPKSTDNKLPSLEEALNL